MAAWHPEVRGAADCRPNVRVRTARDAAAPNGRLIPLLTHTSLRRQFLYARRCGHRRWYGRGWLGVGEGFSVNIAKLRSGSQQVADLQNRCELIAQDAAATLARMAGSAGNAALASALAGAFGQGTRTFSVMAAAYGHVSASLGASAVNYGNTDRAIAAKAGSIFEGLR